MMMLRLAAAWASVAIFLLFGDSLLGLLGAPLPSLLIFVWLLAVIVWAAFGVVHEAEELAERLGEPYGTLILTLSIVIIEVALVGAVMLGAKGAPTLGRDTMFAVLMIVLNGVVGIGLLIGGLRHFQQRYNLKGASSYLAVIIPLTVIPLFLPNFTTSTPDGTLTPFQAVAFSLFTVLLYGAFLILQTGRHRMFFREPELEGELPAAAVAEGEGASSSSMREILPHVGLLWTAIFAVAIGLVMSSAFSALVVYAQEIVPGRVGLVSGIMFGLMFGISGIGAAGLGHLADVHGIVWVYRLCAFLPLLGFATAFLPRSDGHRGG